MLRQTGSKVCILGLAFAALVVAKPPPASEPWSSYGKPAFSRSLGPASGAPEMSSITVPYMPKSSPFFPKFVDPKTMISKKTDLLANLFGGLGPVETPIGPNDIAKYPPGFGPFSPLYATSTFQQAGQPEDLYNANEVIGTDKIKRAASPVVAKAGGSKASKPAKFSPFAPDFSPFAPKFSPFAPKFSPFAPNFSPFAPKVSPFAPKLSPFAPQFSPFAPKFSPFAPKYSPFAPPSFSPFNPNVAPAGPDFTPAGPNYAPANFAPSAPSFSSSGYPSNFGFYDTDSSSSRRRRSIEGSESPAKALGPPPAYPGLAPIAEEPESLESRLQKLSDPANTPKLSLPGMFGPFGPFSPYGPAAGNPAIFAPMKPSFLDVYYQSLATASPVVETATDAPVTEIPVPKSTIVPPGFWAPSGIIPGPTEYTDKVATFLDKLFTSLALNKTAAPATPKLTRAVINEPVDPATSSPKLSLSGKFGPFSPYGPAFANPFAFGFKKPSIFDTLYQGPAFGFNPMTPVTEVPVPKSTVVPPGFWAPSSIIPGPTEYNDKVASFLDKLFTSLAFNKTAPAESARIARAIAEDPEQAKVLVSRSLEDVKKIAIAKDDIVESILAEMGELKTDMIATLDEFFAYSKTLPTGKKPMSPFAAFFTPPTPDPSIPFKQRMLVLSKVFDMLSGIQKNITMAVQDAILSSTDAPVAQADDVNQDTTVEDPNASIIAAFNATLVDAIKNRLASLDQSTGLGYNKPIGSFYGGVAKRDVENQEYYEPEYYENNEKNHEHFKRAVQMQMHQGYQSMPPGTIESVEAGGGTVPGHQGGGIKLLNSENNDYDWEKWSQWADYYKNENEGRNRHHNHH